MRKIKEEDCYIIDMDHLVLEMDEEQPEENYNESNMENVPLQDQRPYNFLRNCNSVGLWICVLYNLCMVLLVVLILIYKH
ncbi:uncharacterized protein LOC108105653 [Drosophila eugracilis]|uniref:uncharacterized protein LOC108105653 n=1 Tax=Drosophila eugracilis TaxID=29029 RepID=UPI0007E8AEFB|nr:uncharacterized protein LOC108105653 [Drosophila eugracilis]